MTKYQNLVRSEHFEHAQATQRDALYNNSH